MKVKAESILTKCQAREYRFDGPGFILVATVRHDDQCGNGHNSFSITGEKYTPGYQRGEPQLQHENGRYMSLSSCGCLHDEIASCFPQLADLIRWHLVSTDGPLHYAANAIYWAGHSGWRDGSPNSPPNLDYLKSTILYGVVSGDFDFDLEDCLYSDDRGFSWNEASKGKLTEWLESRKSELMRKFKVAVESLGFTF